MKKFYVTIGAAIAAAFLFAGSASAQPPMGGFPGGMPPMGGGMPPFDMSMMQDRQQEGQLSIEDEATQKAYEMNSELRLNEKQNKQIYKFLKSQILKERNLKSAGGFGGGFPGGGMPPMGGGPGMGGPGMGGGMPMGGFGGGGQASDAEFEKLYRNGDKKIQKILTPEQYIKWRLRHPRPTPPAKPENNFDWSQFQGFDAQGNPIMPGMPGAPEAPAAPEAPSAPNAPVPPVPPTPPTPPTAPAN